MRAIKKDQHTRLIKRCEEDEKFKNDTVENTTKIELIIYFQYLLDTIELTFIILNAAFVMGMLWIVACEAWEDMVLQTSLHDNEGLEEYQDFFMVQFGLIDNTI